MISQFKKATSYDHAWLSCVAVHYLESWCLLCHKVLWLLVGVFYSQLFMHACYSLSYQCLLAVSTCCIQGLPSFLAMVMDHKKEKIHVFSGFLRFVGNQFKIKMVGKLPFLVGFFAFETSCDLSLRSFGQWLEVTFETDIYNCSTLEECRPVFQKTLLEGQRKMKEANKLKATGIIIRWSSMDIIIRWFRAASLVLFLIAFYKILFREPPFTISSVY